MENLPGTIILICVGGVIAIAFATSMLLYCYMLEPRPKRDITINANMWPLTLPASCFSETGQRIRKVALLIAVSLIVIAVTTLIYVGLVLWLG